MVGKKVLYKSPIDTVTLSSRFHAINGQFLFWQITQMAIAQTLDTPKKKCLHANL